MSELHEMLEQVHAVLSRVMLFCLMTHAGATIKHAITHRKELMGRMIG
ncbi:MAG: hypothetical protein ABW146_17570 [Candidatus Sedimenticola sp. 6PFRAG7]